MQEKPQTAQLISREDTALVIIDVQEKLLPVIHDKETVLQNTVKLAKFAEIVRLPVVITEQANLGPTISEVQNELQKVEKFGKISFDCFGDEGFRAYLGLLGRKNLIIAGIEAHICVCQTTLSALNHYNVHVVGDAVGSRSPHNLAAAMERVRRSGATVTTTEMVMYEILKQAGTDEFRAVLKMVK